MPLLESLGGNWIVQLIALFLAAWGLGSLVFAAEKHRWPHSDRDSFGLVLLRGLAALILIGGIIGVLA